MKNGIEYITCDRAGCNDLIGARRYEDGRVVEEEFVPDYVENKDGHFCNAECAEHKDDFITPDDWLEEE